PRPAGAPRPLRARPPPPGPPPGGARPPPPPRRRPRVLPDHPVTGAELLWALRHEGALDEADLLDRRTRIGLVPEDRAAALEAARGLVDEVTAARRG
ncbi:glycerol-3-phosphate dehydrogenase C-terminal domain-containing protein, partial [Streptomyces sp. NPDC058834]|uniref:glycerol-3-phosphate dehydrogenase C-terminal domain-containing protein n=1 Tax=Streptomyces sp. NPDC058834 TaxID=3346647 RepID=UPI00369C9BE8